MREIQASEAKTHLPQLLDDVERGDVIVIMRHGRAIARLIPELDRRSCPWTWCRSRCSLAGLSCLVVRLPELAG